MNFYDRNYLFILMIETLIKHSEFMIASDVWPDHESEVLQNGIPWLKIVIHQPKLTSLSYCRRNAGNKTSRVGNCYTV